MTTAALTVIALIYLGGFVTLLLMWWKAPEGFEDESGFHYGPEEAPTVSRRRGSGNGFEMEARSSVRVATDWHTAVTGR